MRGSSVNAVSRQAGNMIVKGSLLVAAVGALLTVGLRTTMISEMIQKHFLNEKGDYEEASRDQYYLGLYCFYLMNEEHARVLFHRMMDDYPDSEFVGPALFKIGQTYERKGNGREALLWFRKTVKVLEKDDPLFKKAVSKARQYSAK